MPLHNQKLREAIFQILYSYDLTKEINNDLVKLIADQLKITSKSAFIAKDNVMQIIKKIDEIDTLIQNECSEYKLTRISKIELNILRMSTYEIVFKKSTEAKIIFSEAIRLSKKFSTPSGAGFVNGILNAIYKKL
jgi:transcription antitermination protein NusB